MKPAAWLRLVAALTLVSACQSSSASFDYWILALSWSPEYCTSKEARPDSRQCRIPHEFVVHGLWPQFERGYPENCDPGSRIDAALAERMQPLMPDRGLVFHQWRKHGTCSGLSPERYFSTLEAAADSIRMPMKTLRSHYGKPITHAAIEDAFIALNPALTRDALVFQCRGRDFSEVRICLDTNLQPRRCGIDVREACGRSMSITPGQ